MKKTVSVLLIAVLLLSLTACNNEPDIEDETTIPTTQGTEPTVDSKPDVQEGDVLSQPEKTVCLEELTDLTLKVQTGSSYEVARTITYALSKQGERMTFYERNTEADLLAEDFYGYEMLCVADGDAVSLYSNSRISGSGFTPVELSGEYGTNDGYFRNQLAYLGIDYQDHIVTDGFTKCPDTTVNGVECYVYTFAFTDIFGAGYKAQVCVDKQTGLWLSLRREIPGTEDVFTAEVQELSYDAAVIPGARYTTIPQQGIYEHDGISVTATALDFSNPDYAVLRLETTNTTEVDVQLSSHYVLVNGLCVGGNIMSHICPAGETVQTDVKISNSTLDRSGIDVIRDIRFALWIDEIHMEEDIAISDGMLVENTGELTVLTNSAADSGESDTPVGQVLLDADDIVLRLDSLQVEDNGAGWLNVYCGNGWSEPVQVAISLVSLNGQPYTYSGRITMQEGTEGFGGFSIPHSALMELGIRSIESVELTYEVFLGDSVMSTECIVEKSETVSVELGSLTG